MNHRHLTTIIPSICLVGCILNLLLGFHIGVLYTKQKHNIQQTTTQP